MAKYFKVVEIAKDEFINNTGDDLDCCEIVIPVGKTVYAAIDDDNEYEMHIPLDCFE